MSSDKLFEFAKKLYASQGYTITDFTHNIVEIDEDNNGSIYKESFLNGLKHGNGVWTVYDEL